MYQMFKWEYTTKPGTHDPLIRSNRVAEGGVTRVEIGNILEDFKIDIISTMMT